MTWLVLGATGILGRHAVRVLESRGEKVVGVARSGTDLDLDISDLDALTAAIEAVDPDAIFNCAAIASIPICEEDPGLAYRVNVRPVAKMADWSRDLERPLIHVSTDHFFMEGGSRPHTEDERPILINEYARTKLASETMALTSPYSAILRTNLASAEAGFAKWVIDALKAREPMTLFTDVYCSTISASAFAAAALDMIEAEAYGLYNLAAGEIFSKAQFIEAVANELSIDLDWVEFGSVESLSVRRAKSLGLDVSRAEAVLGQSLPDLKSVARTLTTELNA